MVTRYAMKHSVIMALAIVVLASSNLFGAPARTQDFDNGLFLKRHGSGITTPDPIVAKIIEGKDISAQAGEKVTFASGEVESWTEHAAGEDGWFKGDFLHGAYAYFVINSSSDKVALLESMGDDMVYVNGVPRQGNKYGYKDTWEGWEPPFNYSFIPVKLRKGKNEFLFDVRRGVLKAKLHEIDPGVVFNSKDVTVPDLLIGQKIDDYAAVVLINATDKPLSNAFIRVSDNSGISTETQVPLIQPMSLRKVGFKMTGPAPTTADTLSLKLTLFTKNGGASKELANAEIPIKVVSPSATHNVTFLSDIDGSVQYYAIVPPRGPDNGKPKALFLSLHGADVIATNMANSYYPKTWGYIVCPTNGRPYGFDWEDWGRLDALQVLHIAKSTLNIDPSRIYLTGHSMGGHGTWIIGAQYPDQFGAIGASAGWISWWTYVFRHDTVSSPMAAMLRRATMPVHTYSLKENYKQLGVYALQGSKDDNVPVTESIDMADTLSKFHKDFVFHEEMGVGHWWSLGDQAGADCVDWPPMFDFFARHARPGESRIENIDFTTSNPGVSARDYWLTIYSQEKQLEPSRAVVRFIPSRNRFVGTTDNVKVMAFDLAMADRSKPVIVDLDSTKLDSVTVAANADKIWLEKDSGTWRAVDKPSPALKGPARYGTLKDAFRHHVVFVYGTHGNSEQNKWAFDRARFDAEYFWYQGNGSIDVVPDNEFDPKSRPDGNVILYGNESTNSAWNEVLGKGPVEVSNGKIVFGGEVMKGKGLACLMVRPRKGSTTASVGIVSGTGIKGMRLTYTVPYLQPWFSLPDLTILDASYISKTEGKSGNNGSFGQKNGGRIGFETDGGVRVAGFFGLDWSVRNGDFVRQ